MNAQLRSRMATGLNLAAAGVLLVLAVSWLTTPGFEQVRAGTMASDRWLLDRHGEPLQVQRVDDRMRRLEWTALEQMSPALLRAIVATEDRRFHLHGGVDPLAVAAALRTRYFGGGAGEARSLRGASTITMQLAGLLDPTLVPVRGRRTAWQKLRQAGHALRLGWHWQRAEVLEAYLNRVSFRGELQGVSAAAQALFGKSASALDEAEGWLLAALLAAPNASPARVALRACRLANGAGEAVHGVTSAAAPASARGAPVSCERLTALATASLSGPRSISAPVALAPHVARMLFANQAPERPGDGDGSRGAGAGWGVADGSESRRALRSTLDRDLQRFATDALRSQLEALAARNVRDGAVLVVDNETGQVLAYVGNSGEGASARFVDGVQAPRQAGSTLKPFLYQMAIEQRLLTAASLVDDSPVDLVAPNGLYVPRNYDRQFTGWVSLRTALAGSLNVPAVRTLMLVGADPFADRLRALGLVDVRQSGEFYGYSLALGSAEVRLSHLVNAFRTLANGGMNSPLVLRMPSGDEDARVAGAVGDRRARQRLMSEQSAFIVADMLADRAAGARTFGLSSALTTRGWSAVKTGTSKDMRDNWCVGFSGRYTVGVWVGNFDGSPMHDVSGITGAAPVWQALIDHLHRHAPSLAPAPPHGVVQTVVEGLGHWPPRPEWFVAGTELTRIEQDLDRGKPRIVYPGAGVVVAVDPDIPPSRQRMLFSAARPVAGMRWHLDGRSIGSAERPLAWRPVPGRHRLQLVGPDGATVDEVVFEVRGVPPAVAQPLAAHTRSSRASEVRWKAAGDVLSSAGQGLSVHLASLLAQTPE